MLAKARGMPSAWPMVTRLVRSAFVLIPASPRSARTSAAARSMATSPAIRTTISEPSSTVIKPTASGLASTDAPETGAASGSHMTVKGANIGSEISGAEMPAKTSAGTASNP